MSATTDLPIAGRLRSFGSPILFVLLAVVFVTVSLASWGQQVSTVEMNRNDASCYLILARNLVWNHCYSLDQAAPFRPHTEWPPGVPLLYVPVMALVRDFPLTPNDEALIHGWALFLAVGSLWLLWRYLREVTSPVIALCTTALLASTHAFLDSANAATADALSVGAAFWALREVELYFREQAGRRRWLRVHFALAVVPLIKPYLGMVFVVYLWHVLRLGVRGQCAVLDASQSYPCASHPCEKGNGARPSREDARVRFAFHTDEMHTDGRRKNPVRRCVTRIARGIAMLAVCCMPFAGFIAYSVIAAQQTGDISAVTWLVTDNPTATQAGVAAADHKTLGEWVQGGVRTLRFFLIYNITQSVWSPLSWLGFADWPVVPRFGVMLLTFAVMGLGAARLCVTKNAGSVIYSLAMLAFFIVFACDSPRYFTVLSPMCALLFLEGFVALQRLRIAVRGNWLSPSWNEFGRGALACCCVVFVTASSLWAQHRLSEPVDPEPFYREVYAALQHASSHPSRSDKEFAIFVPYQLKSVAIVESGCSVLSYEDAESPTRFMESWLFLRIEKDPISRIKPTGERLSGLHRVPTTTRFGAFVTLAEVPRDVRQLEISSKCCDPTTGTDE